MKLQSNIYSVNTLNAKEIIQYVSSYPCVSFDIFDTLIKRDVNSFHDTHKIMRYKYQKEHNKKLPFYFYAEHALAPIIIHKKYHKIASLNEMYSTMHISDKNYLMDLECQIELEYVTANPEIYEVYSYCKKAGKKIYAISDMYLPGNQIRKILEKCGYDIPSVYISQERNAEKHDGQLFSIFLKENNLSNKDIVHIGDNYQADILGASRVGISAISIPSTSNQLNYCKRYSSSNLEQNVLYKFISNRISTQKDRSWQIGYEVLGPALYYYTLWLNKQIKKNNIKKLFFLARDGYLLMKAYEYMFGQSQECSCHYLVISRKSIQEACQDPQKKELFLSYLAQNDFYGKVALADIGWAGTIHKSLIELSGSFATVYGFYFGIYKPFRNNVRDNVSDGYFAFGKKKSAQLKMNSAFFDLLYSDSFHGSVVSYRQEAEKISPILSPASPNGKVFYDMQSGAMDFVKAWHASSYEKNNISRKFILHGLLNLAFYPKQNDVDIIKNEYIDGKAYCKVAETKGLRHYMIHPFDFLIDLRNVCWKGGFLQETFQNQMWNRLYVCFNTLVVWFGV